MTSELFPGVFRIGDVKIHAGDIGRISALHEWHNLRLSKDSAPNANPDAPRPIVLIGGKLGIRQTIDRVMARYGVKPATKRTVVAGEFILTANHQYFGGWGYEKWKPITIKKWLKVSMKMLRGTFGDRLAAVILHLDEAAPHLHAYVVPMARHRKNRPWSPNCRKQRIKAGEWKIAARDFFFRHNLIKFQDAYGNAIKAVGLRRGTPGSRAKHREMKNAYRDFKAAEQLAKKEKERLREQNIELEAKLKEVAEAKNRVISEQQNATQLRAELVTEVQSAKNLRAELELERNALATHRTKLRKIPIRQVLAKLGFVEGEDRAFSAMIANESVANSAIEYRVFVTNEQFRTEAYKRVDLNPIAWVKVASGKGAIDLFKSIYPKKTIAQVCERLKEWFPDRTGSLILDLVEKSNEPSFDWEEIASMLAESPPGKLEPPVLQTEVDGKSIDGEGRIV